MFYLYSQFVVIFFVRLDKMSYSTINCAILGAGVIGLSTALRLIESIGVQVNKSNFKITVIADKFDLETTSDGAGGKKIRYE